MLENLIIKDQPFCLGITYWNAQQPYLCLSTLHELIDLIPTTMWFKRTIIIPISQVWKLSHRKIKQLAVGFTAKPGFKPGQPGSGTQTVTTRQYCLVPQGWRVGRVSWGWRVAVSQDRLCASQVGQSLFWNELLVFLAWPLTSLRQPLRERELGVPLLSVWRCLAVVATFLVNPFKTLPSCFP